MRRSRHSRPGHGMDGQGGSLKGPRGLGPQALEDLLARAREARRESLARSLGEKGRP